MRQAVHVTRTRIRNLAMYWYMFYLSSVRRAAARLHFVLVCFPCVCVCTRRNPYSKRRVTSRVRTCGTQRISTAALNATRGEMFDVNSSDSCCTCVGGGSASAAGTGSGGCSKSQSSSSGILTIVCKTNSTCNNKPSNKTPSLYVRQIRVVCAVVGDMAMVS